MSYFNVIADRKRLADSIDGRAAACSPELRAVHRGREVIYERDGSGRDRLHLLPSGLTVKLR